MFAIVVILILVLFFIDIHQHPFFYRKRAAILQKLAGGPHSASFSSATSLGAASMEENHKRTVQLHETVWGIGLTPQKFNGTWVSDSDIMYKDVDGGISVLNLDTNKSYKVRYGSMNGGISEYFITLRVKASKNAMKRNLEGIIDLLFHF